MPPFLGRVPSPTDDRDYSVRALIDVDALVDYLPVRHKARGRTLSLRFDQNENSCVGRSGAWAKIVQERRDLHRTILFDGLALWQRTKERDGVGHPEEDRGTYIRVALEVLCEAAPKIDKGDVTIWDPRMRIASYWRARTNAEIKAAIFTSGSPIIFGSDWPESWFSPSIDGKLPPPNASAGGHAFDCYGWDDMIVLPWRNGTSTRGGYWCPQTWGYTWGANGNFWLPYAAVDEGITDEAWKLVDALDVPKL